MKKQIKIILDPEVPDPQKGDFFEDLLRRIFETQRYDITQRVNFAGMEIDLIAKHKDRAETAYIECKASESLRAVDIKKFYFNVGHQEADYGYFISTTEFKHQVAGLIEEMKGKDKYSNLSFWKPDKIFELLESAKMITPLDTSNIEHTITKIILSYTYFGTFYILILMKNTIPTQFCVYHANKASLMQDNDKIEKLKSAIPEIKDLNFLPIPSAVKETTEEKFRETVAEVQESEHWYDYLPASMEHFIGRKDLKTNLLDFIDLVSSKKTSRRVFYIHGKSGWGKSSLITDLRGLSKNKHYRKRYFVLAVDARSASSSNFVALAFKKLVEKAKTANFVGMPLFDPKFDITSSFDILGSESVHRLLKDLEGRNRTLILIFDQFEDVFRKKGLFEAFYRFLHDVDEVKSNLILGFSWKSEINIPIDHEAYHLWQQAKNFVLDISVREFDSSEINGVIKQLEKSIAKPIGLDLKRRLVESSQGFPWLIKKLCIHTFKQIKAGKTIENLVEQDLNCESLFKDDLEGLSPEEVTALNYIAKCSFEGNFFDATEVDEIIDEPVITELINKRLVVKSGTKYNVYWDIFRDYLVTKEVPPIGESYILRQHVNACFNVYKLFKDQEKFSLNKLKKLHPRHPGIRTLDNNLRELRSVGLIRKVGDCFQISQSGISATEDGFRKYMSKKFERYTPYLKLSSLEKKEIGIPEVVDTLKDIFRGTSPRKKTWNTYAKNLISWFQFTNLDFQDRLIGFEGGRYVGTGRIIDNRETFTPQKRPYNDIDVFRNLLDQPKIDNFNKLHSSFYDLKSIGLITYSDNKVNLTEKGKLILKKVGKKEFEKSIAIEALKTKKIKQAAKYFFEHPKCSRKKLGEALSDLTSNIKSETYKKRVNNILYAWAKFIYEHSDNTNWIH
ncbi:MAG: restriction endonuclease [Candidatus Eremiobacteraeota bacterium]|nr:restriction endonuclease [Candidatus Eremiobacteraeota bacterium]